jgi:DNA-binding response OmpR family regulator
MDAKKILIVDDEPNMLRLLGYALQIEGYQIAAAKSGEEALLKSVSEKPDLVILDVMLPDMDGLEICRRLRTMPETENLPIIMLSALAQTTDKISGLQAGADEYATKPIDPSEIVAKVSAHLRRAQRQPSQAAIKQGRVLGFIGAKGGVGTTTVALNVASALSRSDNEIIAAELRNSFGTFSPQLNMPQQGDGAKLLSAENVVITPETLGRSLTKLTSNFQVFLGPQSIDQYFEFQPETVSGFVKGLTGLADFAILDLPPWPTQANKEALSLCSTITMVIEATPACLEAARLMMNTLYDWGIHKTMIGICVVSQAPSASTMSLTDIRARLGCEIVGVIPPAPEICFGAQKKGIPVVLSQPENVVSTALNELASRVSSDVIRPMKV